jgi:surfeit locus 1 family protein
MNKKFPFVASFICLIAIFILCRLGVWQVERLQWKNNLQAELDAAYTSPPIQLSLDNIRHGEIRRGNITGMPDMSKAIILHGRVYNGRAMQSLVVPFQTEGNIIPLEIGCGQSIDLDNFIGIKPNENMQVTGVARSHSWSYFTPQNNPDKGDWWRLDAKELSNYWGYLSVSPFFITQENVYFAESDLTACPIEKKLRNDHFSYAIFWFTMAFVLMIMWGIRFFKPYIRGDV